MSYSGLMSVKEALIDAGTVYDKIEILSQLNPYCVAHVSDENGEFLQIEPKRMEYERLTSEEKAEVITGLPRLEFMPDYKNMDEKIKCLDHMGVDVS